MFDVYEPKSHEEMTDLQKRASAITLAAMRITHKDHHLNDVIRYLGQHQFTDVEVTDMTRNIRPTLRNLERV